jgi:hypothetical protein
MVFAVSPCVDLLLIMIYQLNVSFGFAAKRLREKKSFFFDRHMPAKNGECQWIE